MKCKACSKGIPRYAPTLRASGYSDPKDLICPICSTLHCAISGLTTEDHAKKIKQDKDKPIWTVPIRTSPYDLDIGD